MYGHGDIPIIVLSEKRRENLSYASTFVVLLYVIAVTTIHTTKNKNSLYIYMCIYIYIYY
jgi:hypothetical protein